MAYQTPTAVPTPPALVSYFPSESLGQSSQKLSDLLKAIRNDRFVSPPPEHPLSNTWQRLDALYDLGEDWNGYAVSAPNPDAIEQAKKWIKALYQEMTEAEHKWLSPHVAVNEDGDVVFEWVRGRNRLNVYVAPKENWFIKAWGPSVADDMEDGSASTTEERLSLWAWLIGQ